MPIMPHFSPHVNETAGAFLAREAAAWEALTPADLEPAEEPTEADRDWNAAESPLNDPSNPLWNERWTVTGGQEWSLPDTSDGPDIAPLYALSADEFQDLCDQGPDVTRLTTHQLIRLYYAAGVELQERLA